MAGVSVQYQRTAILGKKRSKSKDRISNTGVTSSAGEFGPGDRGAHNFIPHNTGNPYDSTNYLFRWQQYVHLYETSWEARKIIRIPIEDALRKPWIVGGIDEKIIDSLNFRLEDLRFTNILSKSMILERLLGGCLTFLGLEGDTDDPSEVYDPSEGRRLRFINAIPVSRITKSHWETDPLSSGYMQPKSYDINGIGIDTSRLLVWDGDPLFDPLDASLTRHYSNLTGFGPSKLAPIWDDIIKAIGTRQAAYQLIKTNNALIMTITGHENLDGTSPGEKKLRALREVANNLSVYRAALIEGRDVSIEQSASSFGSVPELIITFIQILSAASDIPATRFLGQAPGGLNATGDSDLENYYNVVNAIQEQRIRPKLVRIYDILGYEMFPNEWPRIRKDINITFPPLWNETDSEKNVRHGNELDNIIKLMDSGLMSVPSAIDEINLRDIIFGSLDEDDLDLTDYPELDNELDNGAE